MKYSLDSSHAEGHSDEIYLQDISSRPCLGKQSIWIFGLANLTDGITKGGTISYNNTVFDAYSAALIKYSSEVTDPKAAVIGSYGLFAAEASMIEIEFHEYPELMQYLTW